MKNVSQRAMASRLVECAGRIQPAANRRWRWWMAAAAAGLSASPLLAGPEVAQVVRGNVAVQRQGATTVIQASHNAIINYNSFNIGAGETVRFIQPGATSRVLNRVNSADPSLIAGTLLSNGIVYITNPAGVFFANGSLVNVGGIYAAAGNITNADFLANVNRFTGAVGTVENHGTINARAAHLIGAKVANFGSISAPNGMVTMTAGADVYIGEANGNFFAKVSGGGQGGTGTGVTNAGTIAAPGGRVALGAGDMYAMAIDHRGRTRARDITLRGGEGGVVNVTGSLDASDVTPGGRGGTVKVLGDKVGIFGGEIDASGDRGGGTILVGGNRLGQGPEPNAQATFISNDASLRADAIRSGDGGTVIVWSDVISRVFGDISARGGAASGNGGFVETSGKIELEVNKVPDVTAQNGLAGEWLLDPRNVDIVAGAGNVNINTTSPFEPTGNDAQLGVDLVITALTGGLTVTVDASGPAGGQDGRIRLLTDLDYNGTGGGMLRLVAAGDIFLNGSIFDSVPGVGDLLNLELIAGAGDHIHINSPISLGGGSFTASGADFFLNSGGSVTTGNGNFTLNLTGTVTLESNINAGTGLISINRPVLLTSDVALTGSGVSLSSTVNSSGAARNLTITTGAGGSVTMSGAVGNTLALGTLSTGAGGTVQFGGSTIDAASVLFSGPVALTGNTTINAGTVTFGSTLNSDGTARNLIVNTTGAGVTTFTGVVGGVSALGALSTNADGSTLVSAAVTAASATFGDTVTLGSGAFNITSGLTFSGAVTLTAPTTLAAGSVTFGSTLNSDGSARPLTVNTSGGGATTFTGIVGGVSPLGLITTNADGTTLIQAALTATSVTFNDETTISGGTLITSGAQNYNGAVLLGANTTLAGTNITFGSTVNSVGVARNLTVNSSSGGVTTFSGAVGGILALDTLITNADGSTLVSGAVTAASATFGDTVTLGSGAFNITSGLTFSGAVTLTAPTTLAAGSVTFGSTLNSDGSARPLTVNTSGGGATTFTGIVGGVSPLGLITTNADGTTLIQAALTATSVTFNDETTISGGTLITSGAQNYIGAVLLGANTTLAGTNITFGSTVNSVGVARNLTVNSSSNGITTFNGAVGGVLALGTLSTNADGSTLVSAAVTAASVSLADAATLSANITTTGDQTYGGAALLGADVTLAGANVTFGSTLNSSGVARNLTVNTSGAGVTTFTGAIGGSLALGALVTNADGSTLVSSTVNAGSVNFADATTLNGGTVTTSGNQTYGGALTLGANTTLTGQSITFSSTVNSSGIARNLTVNSSSNGITTFNGAVGGVLALGTLSTNADGSTLVSAAVTAASVSLADAATLSANITTTGDQTYGGAALLGADVTLAGANVTFGSTLNSSGVARNLTVNTSGAGVTTFTGAIGGSLALGALVTNADGSTLVSAAVTAASATFGNAVTLGAGNFNITSALTFNGAVTLTAPKTLNVGSATFASTLNSDGSARPLTVNTSGGGATTFTGIVGGVSPLGLITTNADGTTLIQAAVTATSVLFNDQTTFSGGTLITSGTQTYNGALLLGANTTLAGTSITFGSTVNSVGAARNLAVNSSSNGITTFNGVVGGGLALGALSTNADGSTVVNASITAGSVSFADAAAINGGSITTTTDQTYSGAVTLGADTTLIGRDISFAAALNSVGAARNLSISTSGSGIVNFGGPVGSSLALATASINAGGTTTIGSSFAAQSLSITGTTALNGAQVTTTAGQTYGGAVVLGGDSSLDGQTISFGGTVNSTGTPRDLLITTPGGGSTTFGAAVGNALALRDLSVSGPATANGIIRARSAVFGSTLTFNSNSIVTDLDQSYGGALSLNLNTTLAGRNIAFNSTVNSVGAARDLTVNTSGGGTTTFGGIVGGINPLRALVTNADGSTLVSAAITAASVNFQNAAALGGATITTTGTQVYGDGATLISNMVLSGSAITFSGSLNSATARNLTLQTSGGGSTTLAGPVGQSDALGAIVTNADGTTTLGGPLSAASVEFNNPLFLGGGAVTTTGLQRYNGSVLLTANTVIAGGEVRFASTLDSSGSARNLGITTASGEWVRFDSDVGSTLALGNVFIGAGGSAVLDGLFTAASLDIERAALINGGSVTTTGAQVYQGALTLGADAILTGGSLNFMSSIDSVGAPVQLRTVSAGQTRFGGTVGGSAPLLELAVEGGGLAVIAGLAINVDTALFQNPVRLDSNVEVNAPSGTTFASSLNSGGGLPRNLSVPTGTLTLLGAVGAQAGGALGVVSVSNSLALFDTFAASLLSVGGNAQLSGASITTSLDQIYSGDVTLGGDVAISGRAVSFAGAIDSTGGPRALSISAASGSDITFAGSIGSNAALQSLSTGADGRTVISSAEVNTIGGQAYGNPVVLGQSVTMSGGGVAFGSTLNSIGAARALTVALSGGDLVFGGPVGAASALLSLDVGAAGRTRILGGGITTVQDQTFGNHVRLGQSTTVTGRNITFGSLLNADSGGALAVNTTGGGTTTFAGTVGGDGALGGLTTNADGQTRIGADIGVSGGSIQFNDAVVAFGNSTLVALGGDGIYFNNTLDGDGAPDLVLVTDLDVNATALSPRIPVISFRESIGAGSPLGSLTLGGNRLRSAIPTVATIVAGVNPDGTPISDTFTLSITTTGDVTMGEYQKMTVIGNLEIDAGGRVTIGDINARGDVIITAPEIAIRTRPSSRVLGAVPGSPQPIDDPEPDAGVDIVAGGRIEFSVAPIVVRTSNEAELRPTFATPESANISDTLSGFVQRAFGPQLVNVLHVGDIYMDLRSAGPTNANVAEAIAGAAPRESQSGQVSQDTGIGRAQREELTQLGVFARTLEERQLAEFLIGRALYNDVPQTASPVASDYRVTVNRLPSEIVARVLSSYRDVFWVEVVDPETGEVRSESRPDRVAAVIGAAWNAYASRAGANATPLGFREALAAASPTPEGAVLLDRLRILFERLDQLGLTAIELRIARGTLLRAIQVQGLSQADLETAIMGEPALSVQ